LRKQHVSWVSGGIWVFSTNADLVLLTRAATLVPAQPGFAHASNVPGVFRRNRVFAGDLGQGPDPEPWTILKIAQHERNNCLAQADDLAIRWMADNLGIRGQDGSVGEPVRLQATKTLFHCFRRWDVRRTGSRERGHEGSPLSGRQRVHAWHCIRIGRKPPARGATSPRWRLGLVCGLRESCHTCDSRQQERQDIQEPTMYIARQE
jgi:hypothetical protein